MLTGRYTPPQVLAVMTHEWGYTTKRLKRIGGTPITRASIYNLFSNIFYTGYFKRNGEIFPGSHPPLVTMEEFFQVQGFLRRRHQIRHRSHDFAYAGLMECGDCGCAIVGDRKTRKLSGGATKVYTYYACSNARRNCTRRGIAEEAVDRQVRSLLRAIQVPEDLRELGQDIICDWKESELQTGQAEAASRNREIEQMEQKREKLLDLKLRDLLDDDEYLAQKQKMGEELSKLRVQHRVSREQADSVWGNLENTLALAAYGEMFFAGGEPALRALIARTLGVRYVLTNKSLAVEINPVFSPLCEMKKATETGSGSLKGGNVSSQRQLWWGILHVIRNTLLERNATVPSQPDMVKASYVSSFVPPASSAPAMPASRAPSGIWTAPDGGTGRAPRPRAAPRRKAPEPVLYTSPHVPAVEPADSPSP